jgi:cobalamin biosynthesis protein CobT
VKIAGRRSGKLHAPSLHRLRVDDNRIFCKKETHDAHDTAITLLIDNSGSMSVDGKIQLACRAAYAVTQTLERISITHEILGFSTNDSISNRKYFEDCEEQQRKLRRTFSRISPILMYRYKGFEERLNSTIRRRIIGAGGGRGFDTQVSLANNVDGESLLLAARRLFLRKEKRKVMIVLSDGQPHANGVIRHLASHRHHGWFRQALLSKERSDPRHQHAALDHRRRASSVSAEPLGKFKTLKLSLAG